MVLRTACLGDSFFLFLLGATNHIPNGSDNSVAAVIVSHNVGVAAVVDQGKRSICSCTDFILIEEERHDKDNIQMYKLSSYIISFLMNKDV